jgi:hypothetical protein
MVKEEIIEGLKYAVAKGESLPKAMMSFYNAGYLKGDIEEAARALQAPQLPQTQPLQQPSQIGKVPKAQRVSAYGEKPKGMGKAMIMILVFFLILLLGILVAVFLFRDELAALLGNIL